jgi:hypothetical protein
MKTIMIVKGLCSTAKEVATESVVQFMIATWQRKEFCFGYSDFQHGGWAENVGLETCSTRKRTNGFYR